MAGLLLLWVQNIPIRLIFFCALIFSIPMGIDWGLQYFLQVISTNSRRFVSGLLCGFGLGALYCSFLIYGFQLVLKLAE
jgi:uncharacterized membrane protein